MTLTNSDSPLSLKNINADLKALADPAYRDRIQTHFTMNVDDFWGVRTPKIRQVGKNHYTPLKTEPLDTQLQHCETLLKTGLYEHKIIAFQWAHLARKHYTPAHLSVFRRWLNTYVNDWPDCDDLCTHPLGELFRQYPNLAPEVLLWTESDNQWMRRGAAVSLVLPARKGRSPELAFQVAEALLTDDEDLVLKGYGWLLKVTSQHHPEAVFQFVMARRATMPRVSLRYAIEKLPPAQRKQALAKP